MSSSTFVPPSTALGAQVGTRNNMITRPSLGNLRRPSTVEDGKGPIQTTKTTKTTRCCIEMPAWKRTIPIDVDFAKNEKLQILENELDKMMELEDSERVSELEEKLLRLQSGSFVEVMSANMRFYNAINAASIVDIAGCWMQRKDITCKFPFGPLVKGFMDVINNFGYLFSLEYHPMQVKNIRIIMRGSMAYVTCEEVVSDEDGGSLSSYATNIFEKHNGAWYMVHYSTTII